MLTRMLGLFRDVAKTPKIVGSPEKYGQFCKNIIDDQWPGGGPLGGIITALEDAYASDTTTWSVIIGCDMPFLTERWIALLACDGLTSTGDVVVPRSAHGLEPLCACWRAGAVPTLRRAFERGTRKVTEGIALLRTEVLDEPVWKRFDSDGRLFWNMNTVADYEEARRVIEGEALRGQGR
jgi:FdhD protein